MSDHEEPDELVDDLQDLFSDEHLDIPHSSGATDAIVAGARRRRRRRRTAASAAAMAGMLALVGSLYTAPLMNDEPSPPVAQPTEEQPQTSPPTEAPETRAPETEQRETPPQTPAQPEDTFEPETGQPVPDPPAETGQESPTPEQQEDMLLGPGATLGPNGYGELQLHMTFEEVDEAGLLADDNAQAPQGCETYQLAEGTESIQHVTISDSGGVVILTSSAAQTPEGIGVGSSRQDVDAAYPDQRSQAGGVHAPAGEGAYYRLIFAGDNVEQLSLQVDNHDCTT